MVRLTVASTVGGGVLLAVVIGSIWLPAVLMSTVALVEVREDQLRGEAQIATDQILAVFSSASMLSKVVAKYFEASLAASPHNATHYFYNRFGNTVWYTIDQNPMLTGIWVAQLRDPAYLIDEECDLDSALIGRERVADIRPETSGPLADPSLCYIGSPVGCDHKVRVSKPAGHSDPSNPTRPIGLAVIDRLCKTSLGSTLSLWNPRQPGQNRTFHGYTGARWGQDIRVVANAGDVIVRILRPTKGPSWAPLSGLVSVTLRVATLNSRNESRSLGGVLSEAARQTDIEDIHFVVTGQAYLIALSLPHEVGKDMLTLPLASNTSHLPHSVTSVASHLMRRYCTREGEDEYSCEWGEIELHHVSGFTVLTTPLHDPNAEGLGMVLVSMVRDEDVRRPAEVLSTYFAIIAPIILVTTCCVAFVFSYLISRPIFTFSEFLQDAARMKDLERIRSERSKTSVVTEITSMREALGDLVSAMVEYKSFLPTAILPDKVDDEPEGQPEVDRVSDASVLKSTASQSSNPLAAPKVERTEAVLPGTRMVCSLSQKKCTVMAVNLAQWTRHVRCLKSDELSKELNAYAAMLQDATQPRGSVDRLNGDRALISWNAATMTVGYRRAALQAAHAIRVSFGSNGLFACAMGIGVSGGTIISGNAGCETARAFNLIGVPVNQAVALSEIASRNASKVVILASDFLVEVGGQFVMPATGFHEMQKMEEQGLSYRKVVHEVLDPMQESMNWLVAEGDQLMATILNIFGVLQKDPQTLENHKDTLVNSLRRLREMMAFADPAWLSMIDRIGQGDPTAIFHVT